MINKTTTIIRRRKKIILRSFRTQTESCREKRQKIVLEMK